MKDGIKQGGRDHLAALDRMVMQDLSRDDAEVLAEAAEDGLDVLGIVRAGRESFARAQQTAGKRKLAAIQKEMREHGSANIVPLNRGAAIAQYHEILKRNKDAETKITIAARNQIADADDDLDGILDDFAELGLISGNNEGREK